MVYGKGYGHTKGSGVYTQYISGRTVTQSYSAWRHMLKRCYSENYHKDFPSYIGCEVCPSWLNFQIFAKWFEQYYVDGFHLDKDILVKGNKVYSPEFCRFVPARVNTVVLNCKASRGEYPVGVSEKDNKYQVQVRSHPSGKCYMGSFDTVSEAFCAYKKCKEEVIQHIANEYKDFLPFDVYKAMMKYQINVGD